MGDTSTGKSSLLSAIAEIQLPSNNNTRCPLRLRMEKRETESASIRIKWHGSSAYKSDIDHFCDGLQWADIPGKIEELQAIIIETSKKPVARDVIEVNVYGPTCADLTLIDLPGIVRSLGKDDAPSLIEDIKSLTSDYLTNKRCVVLAVIPANVDFHFCSIMQDAKVHDPTTRRTIPVITKPDLIDSGAENSVRALLLGEKMDEFKYGFHMVKCRGQQELNAKKTLKDGLQGEQAFFENKEPWRSTRAQRPELFGIHALRQKLSNLQLSMIQESIPGILKEISTKMSEAQKELDTLGDMVTTDYERRQYFRRLAERAMTAVRESQSGSIVSKGETEKTFITVQQELFDKFGSDMLRQRLANISKVSVGTDVVVSVDKHGKEERGTVVGMSKDGRKICVTNAAVKSWEEDEENIFLEKGFKWVKCDGCDVCNAKGICCFGTNLVELEETERPLFKRFIQFEEDDVRCDPKWLKLLIASNRNNDLRCFLSPTLFSAIVRGMIKKDWKPLCESLIDKSRSLLLKCLSDIFEKEFKVRYSLLWATVEETIVSVLTEQANVLKAALDNVLDMDNHPYTQNHYLYDNINKKRNDPLKNRLLKMIQGTPVTAPTGHVLTATVAVASAVNLINAMFDANSRKSMDDHVTEEMEIVLDSYGKVCAKRIIDQVPMNVMNFNRQVLLELEKVMSSFTDSQLAALIVDGPEFAAKHDRAKNKLTKMKMAYEILRGARSV